MARGVGGRARRGWRARELRRAGAPKGGKWGEGECGTKESSPVSRGETTRVTRTGHDDEGDGGHGEAHNVGLVNGKQPLVRELLARRRRRRVVLV